uniref:Uncharacterized protein n=1 Tax=Ulva partita TaxID=1605170 RepID=A0A1C9ZPU8_9CHLO|nr:hypothetical protein [Ulva partita]
MSPSPNCRQRIHGAKSDFVDIVMWLLDGTIDVHIIPPARPRSSRPVWSELMPDKDLRDMEHSVASHPNGPTQRISGTPCIWNISEHVCLRSGAVRRPDYKLTPLAGCSRCRIHLHHWMSLMPSSYQRWIKWSTSSSRKSRVITFLGMLGHN